MGILISYFDKRPAGRLSARPRYEICRKGPWINDETFLACYTGARQWHQRFSEWYGMSASLNPLLGFE
jgi:hypothetical protein